MPPTSSPAANSPGIGLAAVSMTCALVLMRRPPKLKVMPQVTRVGFERGRVEGVLPSWIVHG